MSKAMKRYDAGKIEISQVSKFCLFGASFIMMFFALSFITLMLKEIPISERNRILTTSALQCILVFIIPALIVARIESRKPLNLLSIDTRPGWCYIIFVIICYAAGMCALNQLIYWNDIITLPESFTEIEKTMREWEENSRQFASIILSDTSIGGLVSGILIVGLLTGISEELFFRAGIQRMLSETMSRHAAIWISAVIFSAMHFQFFGFFPRLILGAFFGYLYVWSGSIWVAIFAHALNNSLVVISSWLLARGIISFDLEGLGVSDSGIPYAAIFSLIITSLLIYKFLVWRKYNKSWQIRHSGK